jgi:hypothetical protein
MDAIASQLTGQRINAGIVLIDTDWAAGKPLDEDPAGLTRIARAASRQYTAGLWTLIAWINWRTNNRPAAWTVLDLALDIDPDEDPAHTLAAFMYDQVDPLRNRPAAGARASCTTLRSNHLTPCRCTAGRLAFPARPRVQARPRSIGSFRVVVLVARTYDCSPRRMQRPRIGREFTDTPTVFALSQCTQIPASSTGGASLPEAWR